MDIGIHLGANYTRVGIKSVDKNDDPPHILRDIDIPREGNADRIASVVSFHEERIKIGTDGLKNQEHEIVFDACRVGTDNDNVEENVTWHAKRSSNGTYQVKKGEKQISQEDIVLEILKRIKEILEKRKYGPIKNVVISTPYKSEDTYKRMIRNAAINAKFNQEIPVLIEETEAAAKSFYELSVPNQYPHNLLVFKFGAGSLSISLAQKQSKNDGLKIFKTTGNPRLGGEDITNLLMQHCLKNFEKDLAEIRKKDLRESCERVKSDLSYFSDTKIIIEGEPRNDIDRNLFDGICKNIIDEICDHMRSITGEMKTREIEIHDVLLVGGSTRLHFIREIIDSALKPAQKSEYRYDTVVIAEEAIALGCAIHGSEPSIEKNGTDMEPTDQDVPNNTGVAPTAQETPNDTGVTPTVQDTPNDTGINSKVKKDNRETDEKQKCENDYPQSNTNPTDQVNAKLIETLPNNQPEDEFRDTSSNDVGIDLVSENPDSIRTSDDNSMNSKQDQQNVSLTNSEHIDTEKNGDY